MILPHSNNLFSFRERLTIPKFNPVRSLFANVAGFCSRFDFSNFAPKLPTLNRWQLGLSTLTLSASLSVLPAWSQELPITTSPELVPTTQVLPSHFTLPPAFPDSGHEGACGKQEPLDLESIDFQRLDTLGVLNRIRDKMTSLLKYCSDSLTEGKIVHEQTVNTSFRVRSRLYDVLQNDRNNLELTNLYEIVVKMDMLIRKSESIGGFTEGMVQEYEGYLAQVEGIIKNLELTSPESHELPQKPVTPTIIPTPSTPPTETPPPQENPSVEPITVPTTEPTPAGEQQIPPSNQIIPTPSEIPNNQPTESKDQRVVRLNQPKPFSHFFDSSSQLNLLKKSRLFTLSISDAQAIQPTNKFIINR